jgi:pimeloyl-ACP methyl ester carboxylesterase
MEAQADSLRSQKDYLRASQAYRAALRCIVTFNRIDDLARIACPTLVLAAEHDTLAPPKTMERMAARIPGALYRCIAGAGHLANFEQTASFAAALDEFLATLA